MFGQLQPTEFDIQFSLLGIPVRIHVSFWILAILIGWSGTDGHLPLIFLNAVAILVSVLVHEMGHALMYRYYGWGSNIVLHYMGGFATGAQFSYWKNIAVSAAGPGAGILLAILTGLTIFYFETNFDALPELLMPVLRFLLAVNIIWSIFNLLPLFPFDGGQITRNFLMWAMPRNGLKYSLIVSMVTAALMLYVGIQFGAIFLILFAVLFGYNNYQEYQSLGGRYW